MTYRTRPIHGQGPTAASRARLAALDLTQDDIVRPELRNDAILSGRSSPSGVHRQATARPEAR
ncbi:hypothetical protein [Halomonas ramblicola]|uniref:hypothetical protein n=1 Tax=Halomonas ramblicola TaxID=747349 RepID=UPI0025B47EEF|nr:hypothetical protein [Halomonas ramblicola]MDN3523322.1 hypothetical protein [Halomonas ramblicola]